MKNVTSDKRNLWMFPLGTVGRDMIYNLFTNFIFTYILFTRHLTAAQLGAVTAIMVGARVFDALNDPVMGNIIERTRSRYGKFKPWLVIGILSTSVVVYLAFNTSLQGWSFIAFFGVIYFLYSITYTMHDISYWGMVSALSSDPHVRNSAHVPDEPLRRHRRRDRLDPHPHAHHRQRHARRQHRNGLWPRRARHLHPRAALPVRDDLRRA